MTYLVGHDAVMAKQIRWIVLCIDKAETLDTELKYRRKLNRWRNNNIRYALMFNKGVQDLTKKDIDPEYNFKRIDELEKEIFARDNPEPKEETEDSSEHNAAG